MKNVDYIPRTLDDWEGDISPLESRIGYWLIDYNIPYLFQSPDPTNPRRVFDFRLPQYKIVIEADGRQHYEYPNKYHKTRAEYDAARKRDREKDAVARSKGYRVIRLRSSHEIESILFNLFFGYDY